VEDRVLTDEQGTFDPEEFAGELEAAPHNHAVGTSLWFENEHIKVYELRLDPGERAPFHIHDTTYFWTVVDAGRGLQRSPDGTSTTHGYALGETAYRVPTESDPLIHDLENVGDTALRFVTVELKH
jgi:hypothetical protein